MPVRSRRSRAVLVVLVLAGTAAAVSVWLGTHPHRRRGDPANSTSGPGGAGATAALPPVSEAAIRHWCTRCHKFAEPEVLPTSIWRFTIEDMYKIAGYGKGEPIKIPLDPVVAWFETRAPERLPLAVVPPAEGPGPLQFKRRAYELKNPPRFRPAAVRDAAAEAARAADDATAPKLPGVANVRFLDVVGDARLELVVCDMTNGLVLMAKPYEESDELEMLAVLPFPAHAEVVDLDGDGDRDLVVACLGWYKPTDETYGSVVWLRNCGDEGFKPITLATGLGRVADVQAADFNGDGKIDLVVAEFGWRTTGRVILLENHTEDWSHPRFDSRTIDTRHGAIHVPVADLDGDGRPDFVVLLSQEHEAVVAYLNRGDFQFEKKELYSAPHSAWGSTGMQLVDLDGDGDLDVLVTNGDSADVLPKLRPYHGIQWLENTGDLKFVPHPLRAMYGVHRAEAADLCGSGRMDIVACSFIPLLHTVGEDRRAELASIVWLEQTETGQFVHHSFETQRCDHATLTLGDFNRDGAIDLAVGNFTFDEDDGDRQKAWVELWENLRKK